MIAAIFARIFGRLEQFVLLWQSGLLPAPPIRHTAAPSSQRARQAGHKPRARDRCTGVDLPRTTALGAIAVRQTLNQAACAAP